MNRDEMSGDLPLWAVLILLAVLFLFELFDRLKLMVKGVYDGGKKWY